MVRRSTTFALAMALFLGLAAPVRSSAQAIKPSTLVEHVKKGRFSDADREIAESYLKKHADELPTAPEEAERILLTHGWVEEVAKHGSAVPESLERKLSPSCKGIRRVIFNRTLMNVRVSDGAVLDRVPKA